MTAYRMGSLLLGLVVLVAMIVLGACVPGAARTGQAPPEPGIDGQERVHEAQALINKREFAQAEAILVEVVERSPRNAAAWFMLGYAQHAQGKLREALEAHEQASKSPQYRGRALYNVACVRSLLGEVDAAFEALKEAVESGFNDRELLQKDTDLANLRKDPRFIAMFPPLLRGSDAFVEPTRVIHEIESPDGSAEFGWVARRLGDLDKDGTSDFVVTAPAFAQHAGRAYVYSGKGARLLFHHTGEPGSRLGNGAGDAGDVNSDGTPDVIVGAPAASKGRALVLSGKDGQVLLTLQGDTVNGQFGYKVAGLGDLNGDEFGDVAVTTLGGTGKAQVFSGRDGSLLAELSGEAEGDKFGSAVAGKAGMLVVGAQDAGEADRGMIYAFRWVAGKFEPAWQIAAQRSSNDLGQMFASFPGDLDRDGIDDVFVSDFADKPSGRALVVSGSTGRSLWEWQGTELGEGFGTSVSDAGDVTGDGIGDLIIGSWQHGTAARSGGRATLYSGSDGKVVRTWTCRQAGDTFGFDATGIGDVDGDGTADLLISSAWSDIAGPKSGRVFALSGK